MTVSRSIHVSTNDPISFLFMAEQYSIVCIYHIFFIHSFVNGYLGCFYMLVIVNNASMNMGMHISCRDPDSNSFGYIPQSRIARSYGKSNFNCLKKPHTVFHRGFTLLHFTSTKSVHGFQFLHILTNTCYLLNIYIIAILTGVSDI